ncbi:MAG: RNA polymerase factor sigma-54 [Candidatus Kapabacteria bacterium]|nr:RNA polymerase factor sigma-54 [Candidatus Kapabacteria bacterium]
MKLGLSLQVALQQTLTPQQIQYLKMLQLTAQQIEQQVRSEMENNPMLEESASDEAPIAQESYITGTDVAEDVEAAQQAAKSVPQSESVEAERFPTEEAGEPQQPFEPEDAFEFYKLLWGEDPSAARASDGVAAIDEDDNEGFQIQDAPTFEEDLIEQLRFLPLSVEDRLFGTYIIGNVDSDGYLRRDMTELLQEFNAMIAEHNLALVTPAFLGGRAAAAKAAAVFEDVDQTLMPITAAQAEHVIRRIQSLDPPGVASRNVRECLLAQLRAVRKPNAAQKLAMLVLTDAYEAFAMKHYPVIERQLDVEESYLREALEVIRRLNPRPGGGTFESEMNTVVPDFIVERDEEHDDFLVTVNDSRLPTLRVNSAYERIKKDARYRQFNKETREWMRKKYEDAKFLVQALRQRKSTMLKVMTTIVALQKDFFRSGPEQLKPLIYRDVSEIAGMDISTICRIVNGKYVQSQFGTFELKYFFSESLVTDEGEEVSTRIIKQKIKEMIDAESKYKPLSDDKLAQDLKKLGYNVARRTVAKYREQLRIPVARLRKEL